MVSFAGQIVSSLNNEPEKWSRDRFNIKNSDNGIAVWIANGFWFIECEYPYSKIVRTFNLYEKFFINRAIKKWQQNPI